MEKLENENVSLEFQVQTLVKERKNVKLEYQKHFDSIKKTRTQTRREMDELIENVNQKTCAYGDVRAKKQDLLITISGLKAKLKNIEKGDYSRPNHGGYQNTIELPDGNNVVPLRSDTIRLVQNGFSFFGLRSEDQNQHLKDFLKIVDSFDLNVENRKRTHLVYFNFPFAIKLTIGLNVSPQDPSPLGRISLPVSLLSSFHRLFLPEGTSKTPNWTSLFLKAPSRGISFLKHDSRRADVESVARGILVVVGLLRLALELPQGESRCNDDGEVGTDVVKRSGNRDSSIGDGIVGLLARVMRDLEQSFQQGWYLWGTVFDLVRVVDRVDLGLQFEYDLDLWSLVMTVDGCGVGKELTTSLFNAESLVGVVHTGGWVRGSGMDALAGAWDTGSKMSVVSHTKMKWKTEVSGGSYGGSSTRCLGG
ncbi:hypothetical protein Tco_1211316 [Tanacetum coccineum]